MFCKNFVNHNINENYSVKNNESLKDALNTDTL